MTKSRLYIYIPYTLLLLSKRQDKGKDEDKG
jgi:hypothetical protein